MNDGTGVQKEVDGGKTWYSVYVPPSQIFYIPMQTQTLDERKKVHQWRLKVAQIEKIKELMVEHGITIEDLSETPFQNNKEKLARLRSIMDSKEKHRRSVRAATIASAEARRLKKLRTTQTGEGHGQQETEG